MNEYDDYQKGNLWKEIFQVSYIKNAEIYLFILFFNIHRMLNLIMNQLITRVQ